MNVLVLGALGYAATKLGQTTEHNSSIDSLYSSNSQKKFKKNKKKLAKKRKEQEKTKKIKVKHPKNIKVKNKSNSTNSQNSNSSEKQKYNYENQFDNLKYSCNKPVPISGLDEDEMRHIVNERELFARGTSIQEDMTYDVVPNEDFTHNNLQPFGKMKGLKNDNWKNRNTLLHQKHGLLHETYTPKREIEPMFKPQKNFHSYNSNSITKQRDRFLPGRNLNGQLPFDQIKVTPGIGLGANEDGKHARHDSYRPPQKTIDDLRPKNNQQQSFTKPVIQGQRGSRRGIAPKVKKNKPERVYQPKIRNAQDQNKKTTYTKKKFHMPVTDRGKKKKRVENPQQPVNIYGGTDQAGKSKTPFRSSYENNHITNAKNSINMYDPNFKSFNLPENERDTTNAQALPKPAYINIGNVIPNQDKTKTTVKETTLFNRDGNIEAMENAGTVHNTDKTRKTIKQQTLYQRDGNIEGMENAGTVHNTDKTRKTIKQQTIFQRDGYIEGMENAGTVHNNDKTRTTIKQQTLFNRDANVNGLQKTVATQYSDKAKITIKQQTIYQRDGYLKGKTIGYYVDYKDVPATTLKQLLCSYQREGMVKGLINKSHYIDFNDIPAQTLKDMVVHNKYIPGLFSLEGAKGGYLSANYKAPTTLKEVLNNLFWVGSVKYAKLGGHLSNKMTARTTLKQLMHVFKLSNIGKQINNHRVYDAEYNATVNVNKDKVLKRRKPTRRKHNKVIGKKDINARLVSKANSARPNHAVSRQNTRTKFNMRLNTKEQKNPRNMFSVVKSQLNNNPYALNIN